MERIDLFNSILQFILCENNDMIQQAQNSYIDLLKKNPDELALMHFQVISTTNNEHVRTLALVLLGNYFTLLKQYEKIISPETSQIIKSSIFMFFQNENFTEYHFGIITSIIFKSAQYFKNNWPELSDLLVMLLSHPNPMIISAASCCLADCIDSCLIDLEKYFEVLLLHVQAILSLPPEPINVVIPSTLQLLYSLADPTNKVNNSLLIPIINLIPKYLATSQDNPRLINDFNIFAHNHMNLFFESLDIFYTILADIFNDPNFSSGIKNTSIYIINLFVKSYPVFFQSHVNMIFDFYASKLPLEETHESLIYAIMNLSDIYGGDFVYATHVYDFFCKNVPSPFAYIVIGVSYEGIKDHFLQTDFSKELLPYFSQGFTSNDDFTRLKAFQYFIPLLKIFFQYDDDISPETNMNILLSVMVNENNPQVLFYQLKMLSRLLNYYVRLYTQVIPDIVKLLDQLFNICNQPQYIAIILKCYKSIAESERNSDSQIYSQHSVLKMSQYLNNPLESEELFFFCIKMLPSFNSLIPQNVFDELIANVFNFLFSVVYDGNGYENPEYNISSYARSRIASFFNQCLNYHVIDNSPQILEKVLMISFNTASSCPNYEIINTDADISIYENYDLIPGPTRNRLIVISRDEILRKQESLIALYHIFSLDVQLIPSLFDNLYELIIKLLQASYCEKILHNIYELEVLLFPFIQNESQISALLKAHSFSQTCSIFDLTEFNKLLIVVIKTVGVKWNQNRDIIIILFQYAIFMFFVVETINEKDKAKAIAIQNIAYDDCKSINAIIYCTFVFRELFRFFPLISIEFFPKIYDLVNCYQKKNELNKKISSIIFADYIRFCPQENPEFFSSTLELFKEGLISNHISIQLVSIYGLSIIITPKFIDVNSMKIFADIFMNCVKKDFSNEDIKSMVSFAFLQLFQNYSPIFDVSIYFPQFFEIFGVNIYTIPKYCREYYAQSLVFFVSNFRDSIPTKDVEKFQYFIKRLSLKHLDPALIEDLNSVLVLLDIKNV